MQEDAAVLRGTKDGYRIILDDQASVKEIFTSLKKLLDSLQSQSEFSKPKTISFDIKTGSRLLSSENRSKIEKMFADSKSFQVHKISSDVITKEKSDQLLEEGNIHILDNIIRNGQQVEIQGDVLFLGKIHEGGKLIASGNIFVFGEVKGIVQAGVPNFENKMIIGDVHTAQQVRIGEQFEILDDTNTGKIHDGTVIYVNDLHVIDYAKVEDIKEINPKFFNQIGGIVNG